MCQRHPRFKHGCQRPSYQQVPRAPQEGGEVREGGERRHASAELDVGVVHCVVWQALDRLHARRGRSKGTERPKRPPPKPQARPECPAMKTSPRSVLPALDRADQTLHERLARVRRRPRGATERAPGWTPWLPRSGPLCTPRRDNFATAQL